jgi:hypothetical protein
MAKITRINPSNISKPFASYSHVVTAEGAPQEDRADGVFSQVRALASHQYKRGHTRVREIRKQPSHQGPQDSRGAVGRVDVGGAEEDQRHPQ